MKRRSARGLLALLARRGCGRGWCRNDHDDRRITRGLGTEFRIRVALRAAPGPVLHRYPGWECHRLFAEAADLEHVRRRLFEHEITFVLQLRTVVGEDLCVRRRRAEQVVLLPAPGIVRGDELGGGV